MIMMTRLSVSLCFCCCFGAWNEWNEKNMCKISMHCLVCVNVPLKVEKVQSARHHDHQHR